MLTEGAISRQIARLKRSSTVNSSTGRGAARLNPAGARYARQVREILARLERTPTTSADACRWPQPGGSPCSHLASRWLIPGSGACGAASAYRGWISPPAAIPFILPGSGFDAAIHFGTPGVDRNGGDVLFAEYLLPVCHAALLTDDDLPGLLNRLTRIHRRQNPDAWVALMPASAVWRWITLLRGRATICMRWRSPRYLAIAGCALVPKMYVESELSAGTLVAIVAGPPDAG